MSLQLVKYALTAAVRDRLIIALLLLLALGTSMSLFMGSAAVTEKDQFSLVYAGGGLRLIGVFGLVLFVVFFIRRSFEARDVEYLLSRPIGRVQFLLSYAAAFSILAVLTALAQTLCLYVLGPHLFGEGAILWCASIMIENIIMVNTALFFAMYITSPAGAAMGIFAFYVLARMMGQILGIMHSTGKAEIHESLEMIMNMVSVLVPRLDLMGQTSWLVYGTDGGAGLGFLALQGAVFSALILAAALIDLVKRQF